MTTTAVTHRLRKEVWIKPGALPGQRSSSSPSSSSAPLASETTGGDEETADLRELSVTDLNRRFTNTFLYLVGKLYTHINMETFGLALDLLGREFRLLVLRRYVCTFCS